MSQTNHQVFNVESALKRLMNNETLYKKILARFEAEYSDFDQKLTQLISEQKYTDAAFQLHAMKGVAGNLGAEQLWQLCQNLEALCKKEADKEEMDPCLNLFLAEYRAALVAVQSGSVL